MLVNESTINKNNSWKDDFVKDLLHQMTLSEKLGKWSKLILAGMGKLKMRW